MLGSCDPEFYVKYLTKMKKFCLDALMDAVEYVVAI